MSWAGPCKAATATGPEGSSQPLHPRRAGWPRADSRTQGLSLSRYKMRPRIWKQPPGTQGGRRGVETLVSVPHTGKQRLRKEEPLAAGQVLAEA